MTDAEIERIGQKALDESDAGGIDVELCGLDEVVAPIIRRALRRAIPRGSVVVPLEKLREIEWPLFSSVVVEYRCAVCKRTHRQGHAPDCWLADAPKDSPTEPGE